MDGDCKEPRLQKLSNSLTLHVIRQKKSLLILIMECAQSEVGAKSGKFARVM